MNNEPDGQSESDEINREDGLERYWLFYNGESVETIFGFAAGVGGVFWCFLYILDFSQTIIAYVLGALAIVGFCGWYLLVRSIRRYEEIGWRKQRGSSASSDKKKLYVALGLWAFILLFFGTLMLSQQRIYP